MQEQMTTYVLGCQSYDWKWAGEAAEYKPIFDIELCNLRTTKNNCS